MTATQLHAIRSAAKANARFFVSRWSQQLTATQSELFFDALAAFGIENEQHPSFPRLVRLIEDMADLYIDRSQFHA